MNPARRILPALALLLSAALWAALPASAEPPVLADLTSHLIAVTTGFTGTSVVLFGATSEPGAVVAIVRGPEHDVVVRKKSRVAGIWMNTKSVGFAAVPSYYAVFSSAPLDEIASRATQALHQIGTANLRLAPRNGKHAAAEVAAFRTALLAEKSRKGLCAGRPGRVGFLGNRLFRATISFPANVPIGTYLVEILLLRDGNVVSGQTTPLVVSETGLNADLNEFALGHALLYGIAAVAGAVLAGGLSRRPGGGDKRRAPVGGRPTPGHRAAPAPPPGAARRARAPCGGAPGGRPVRFDCGACARANIRPP